MTIKRTPEAAIKYFIIQAAGGGIILVSIAYAFNTLTTAALLLKLGAAPLQFWVPAVYKTRPWGVILVLRTWQKLVPLSFLGNLRIQAMLEPLIALNGLIGGLGGIIQTSLRGLLAYSSISHLAWLIARLKSRWLFTLYLRVYFCSLTITLTLVALTKRKTINRVTLTLRLLSLGGLPPLIGFIPKWLILIEIRAILALWLVLARVLALSYYLLLFCHALLTQSNPTPIEYLGLGLILLSRFGLGLYL